ncbi:MAG TPA: DUF2231 domain-containing protein [Vicinamibacterales bacterium]|nr:DUF2231 domain-containing protein [Vicinamibacterales bacterium]
MLAWAPEADVGYYHPMIVHFAIALLAVGVVFRLISLLRRPSFVGPAALVLIGLGTISAVLAVNSGDAAHGPVERVPGARAMVVEHEEWGERTRNIFFIVIALEAIGLMTLRSERSRYVYMASAGVGVVGLVFLYQAASHGGELVYSYAGGVGIRSGDPADTERLLLAGLYQQAQVDRAAGRTAEANGLLMQAARRYPNNIEVQLAAAESQLTDRKDPQGALEMLQKISAPQDDQRLRVRHGILTADALALAGQREGAVAVLQELARQYPEDARLKQRIDAISSGNR